MEEDLLANFIQNSNADETFQLMSDKTDIDCLVFDFVNENVFDRNAAVTEVVLSSLSAEILYKAAYEVTKAEAYEVWNLLTKVSRHGLKAATAAAGEEEYDDDGVMPRKRNKQNKLSMKLRSMTAKKPSSHASVAEQDGKSRLQMM